MARNVFKFGRLILCASAFILGISGANAEIELETRSVSLSENISIGDRVGRIRFLGMLALPDITHNGVRLSQLSGVSWDDDEEILYAVTDKGGLFHLQPRIKNNILTGVRLLQAHPLRELDSGKPLKWSRADSEDLYVLNGNNRRKGDSELIISFERHPRIVRYRPDGHVIEAIPLPEELSKAENYAADNRMLESVCVDLSLGIITAPEVPLKSAGHGATRIFNLSGLFWRYPYASGDRITAMACLGNGEVLVLQQNFRNPLGNVVVMLKRVRLKKTASGERLEPETVVTMDSVEGYHVDNFEGLTRHKGNRFFMISDNNDLFVQRSLLMYFEILDN
jgi:hypothetical protein